MPTPGEELSSINFESMLGGPLVAVVNAQAQAAISTVNFIKQIGFKPVSDQPFDGATTGDPIYVSFRYPKEISPYVPQVGDGSGSLVLTLTNAGSGYNAAPTVTIGAPPTGGTQAVATLAAESDGTLTLDVDNPGAGYVTVPTITIAAGAGNPGTGASITASVNRAQSPAVFQDMKLEVPILTIVPIPYLRVETVTIDFNAKINSVEYVKTDESIKIDAELEARAGWGWGSARLKVNASYQKSTQTGTNVERTYSLAVHIQASQDEMPGGMERILGILEDAIKSQPLAAADPVALPAPAPA